MTFSKFAIINMYTSGLSIINCDGEARFYLFMIANLQNVIEEVSIKPADIEWPPGNGKKTKQQPSLLPGPAVSVYSLVSFHFLLAILCPQAVDI